MANDPRLMTPGSEVADTLQAILARKRETERQAMLDKLAAEEQRSVQEAREAETQRLADTAAAQIAQSKEATFQSKKGDIRRGTKPESIADEELRNELVNRGMFETRQMQGPPSPGQEEMPSVSFYKGTPEEEERERRLALFDELSARNPEMAGGLDILSAGGPAIPSMLTRRVPAKFVRPEDLSVHEIPGVEVPEGDALHFLPYKPIGYGGGAAGLPKPWRVFDDATGKDIGGVSLAASDMGAWYEANPGKSLRPPGFQARPDARPEQGILNRITKAQGDLAFGQASDVQKQGLLSRMFGGEPEESPTTAAARAELASAIAGLLASDPNATPNVVDVLSSALSDPQLANASVQEIVSLELEDEQGKPIVLSPQEIGALSRALVAIRGINLMPTGQ